MARMPYKLALRIKERDGDNCLLCGNPDAWVKVIDDTKPITPQNLVVLCDTCEKQKQGEEVHRYLKACYKGVK